MAGRVQWEAQVDSNVAKLLSETKELRDQLDGIKKGNYEIKLNIDDKKLEKVISNLDKMLESLGKGTGDFKEFENLFKQLNEIVSEVKELNKAFGGINDSGVSNLLSSIQSIDKSLSSLSEHITNVNKDFGSVGKNASDNVGQINEAKKATEGLTEATRELANAQKNVDNKSNISSPIKDTFQGDVKVSSESSTPAIKDEAKAMEQVAENAEKASKGKDNFAKANKKVKESADSSADSIEKETSALDEKEWDKNVKAIQEYMDANTKLNNLKAQDKGTGKKTSEIAYQTKEVEKLEKVAIEARAALSSMINPHEAPIDDWNKWLAAMKQFDQATEGSAESLAKLEDSLRNMAESQFKKVNDTLSNSEKYLELLKPTEGNRSVSFEKVVQEYDRAVNSLKEFHATLDASTTLTKEQSDKFGELAKKVKDARTEIDKIPKALRGSDEDSRMKEIDKLTKYLDANTRISKEAKQQLQGYLALLKSGDPSVNVKELHTAWTKVAVAEREAGREGKRFWDILSNKVLYGAAAKLATYYLSFYDFIRYARNGINAVRELDTALVDLQKTTTMNTNQLEDFYYASNDVAKQMGVTTSEIINQASAWSRLGYSRKEAATEMAALSSQFASISPGMDLDTATDGLVSTMKAFDIEVEDVERRIMDNINRIGNTAATSNDEIVDMLTRSSAAMAVANNTLEETIALETAAVEITRNAESTGTAFKTISMRIRGYDEETEELSEDLKNISGDIADLTKTSKTPGGISLFTDENKTTYKSTYQILKEISEIYDELTDKQQADLLEKLAGKRGGQVVGSLLLNFEAAEKALKEMEQAAGSADAEMSIIEESIDYKLNALKETWVGNAQDLLKRDDFGKLVDGLTKLSEAIGLVIEKAGLLGTIGIGAGAFAGIKNVGINMLVAY